MSRSSKVYFEASIGSRKLDDDLSGANHERLFSMMRCAPELTIGTIGTPALMAIITAQSGVPNDVPARGFYSGYPVVENRQWLKMMAALQQLPELQKRVRELEAQVERLKS